MGYSPWGCKELDTTESLTPSLFFFFSLTYSGRVGVLEMLLLLLLLQGRFSHVQLCVTP